ncbi:MAG: arylsulfatase [Armatimonadota bacterium]
MIFILADDLGYGDLGCYGQQRIQTPNLDRFAAEGVRFTDAYAGSTVCAPSRCSLMTGLHTGHCRVRGNARVPLRPEDVTVAEVLKRAGYVTGIIGKWGLGEPDTTGIPNRQGFDEWFGYLNQRRAHNYYPEHLWKNESKFPLSGNLNGRRRQYSHDLFTEYALWFLRRHQDRPFFLYLAYTIPHANNELGRETGNGMEVPSDEPYSDERWPQPQKNHAAMITRMDADIGRLMERLKRLGLDENTIVFFSSDNGPHREGGADPNFFDSNGPLRGIKRDLYEGGIRVPAMVRWPGKIEPGTVSDFPWAFWDFLPTAADIAGVAPPADLDGTSILPTLLGREQEPHRFMYWEFHEGPSKQAVRMGSWKAVRLSPSKPLELYDLSTDIGETKNVADEHPDVVAKIEEYLETARTESEHWPLSEGKRR